MANENFVGSEIRELTASPETNKTNEIVSVYSEIVDMENEKRNENEELKRAVDKLLSQYPSLKEWFEKKSESWIKTISSLNTYQIFLKENEQAILSLGESWINDQALDDMFLKWNSERLLKLKNWLTYEKIKILSLNYQKQFVKSWNEPGEDKFVTNLWNVVKDKIAFKNTMDLFSNYSLIEIVWELILKEDFRNPKALEEIQYLASCFVVDDKEFQISVDGLWWPQTWAFFDSLLDNPDFVNSANWALYVEKIQKVMKWRRGFEWRRPQLGLYRSVSEVSNSMEEYAKDPVNYWKKQSVLSRHFVWLEAKTPYPSVDSMTKSESAYIDKNLKGSKLNSDLSKLFDKRWKSPEEQAEIDERLKALMPKDVLEAHLNKFLSNEKVREEFSRNFNLPPTTLDDPYIIQAIQNGMAWNDEFKDIRDWILSWMWTSIGWELISLSIDLQSYIRKQCWISALWVKTKFLQWIFWKWSEIETLDKDSGADPDSAEYTLYFKDKNCPSTTYEYRPNTWEIFAEKAYNFHDNIVSFWQTTIREKIYTMDAKFSDFIQDISVEDLLPKERCDTRMDLKNKIAENIEDSMNYSIWDSQWEALREMNDIKRFKNWIVDTTLRLLWYKKMDDNSDVSISLTEQNDGAYYRIMSRLVDAVDWAKYDELDALNQFLTSLSKKINSINDLDIDWEPDSLLKFVLGEYKLLSAQWDTKVEANNKADELKKKDLILWVLFDSLYKPDGTMNFEKVRAFTERKDDGKYNELVRLFKIDYYDKAQKFDVAVVKWNTGRELHWLEEDVSRDNEYAGQLDAAYDEA